MSLTGIFPIEQWNFTTRSVLAALPEEQLNLLTGRSEELNCRKGEVLFREGTIPSGIYLINSGKIKKYKTDRQRKEQIVYVAGPGELVGYHAVLSEDRYPDSAAAMEDALVTFIPKENFTALLERSPVFARRLLKAMSQEFTVLTNTISVIAQRTGAERLAITLIVLRERSKQETPDGGDIVVNISRADLANMAGVAEENVTRILREFKTEGLLETKGRSIIINDIRSLVQRANYR